jgi:hypothetical protein
MAVSLLVTYAEQYESAVDMALTYADVLLLFKDSVQVRKTPSWPRSWANFSLL